MLVLGTGSRMDPDVRSTGTSITRIVKLAEILIGCCMGAWSCLYRLSNSTRLLGKKPKKSLQESVSFNSLRGHRLLGDLMLAFTLCCLLKDLMAKP